MVLVCRTVRQLLLTDEERLHGDSVSDRETALLTDEERLHSDSVSDRETGTDL